jgi:hypothetical protein
MHLIQTHNSDNRLAINSRVQTAAVTFNEADHSRREKTAPS